MTTSNKPTPNEVNFKKLVGNLRQLLLFLWCQQESTVEKSFFEVSRFFQRLKKNLFAVLKLQILGLSVGKKVFAEH